MPPIPKKRRTAEALAHATPQRRIVSGADLFREELGTGAGLFDAEPAAAPTRPTISMESFEQWIKLATDNKINTANSWNVELIDYFHDLRVIRDGDNLINFQRASATLDGCVKIYSSRVDSVASETGKLLTGLATEKAREPEPADGAESENDEEEEDEEAAAKPKKKKHVSASTLVAFDTLRVRRLEKELAIDPVFKKALAEFDEGGAKSLLLNTLVVDDDQRVVFGGDHETEEPEEEPRAPDQSVFVVPSVDISDLKSFLYTAPGDLAALEVCPPLRSIEKAVADPAAAKGLLDEVAEAVPPSQPRESTPGGFDDALPDLDLPDLHESFDFANQLVVPPEAEELFEHDDDDKLVGVPVEDGGEYGGEYGVAASVVDHDLMAYFDSALRGNWQGPQHWKVQMLTKRHEVREKTPAADGEAAPRTKKPRFSIDFMAAATANDLSIFVAAKHKSATSISKKELAARDPFDCLLPEDLRFSLAKLTQLGLKPHVRVAVFARTQTSTEEDAASFFASAYEAPPETQADSPPEAPDFDLPFEHDYDMGQQFAESLPLSQKARPEYVNYSRTAKKVDVKLLKDNMWQAMEGKQEVTLALVVGEIGKMYPPEQRRDLSTSFYFICMLHLANEHGCSIHGGDQVRIKMEESREAAT